MNIDISDASVLAIFDQLVHLGVIHYGPSRAVSIVHRDFPIELRLCPTWSKKPMTVDTTLPVHKDIKPESFGPGSDIHKSHASQVIGTVNGTHVLAFNIYPIFRPQYLLLTLDSYRSQNEPLDLQDIEAAWAFLHSVRSPHFVMYNCTRHASCSRNHKHLQILRKPEVADTSDLATPGAGDGKINFRFFPDMENMGLRVPYVYYLHKFSTAAGRTQSSLGQETQPKPPDSKAVFEIYAGFLRKCRRELGIGEDDSATLCAHNVLIVKEWILVIPRRLGIFKGVSANTLGMMGMPTVPNVSQLTSWVDLGPSQVLSELGIPRTDILS